MGLYSVLSVAYFVLIVLSVLDDFSIKNLMTETPTSYSLLIMHKDVIYAVRDPYGNRPLSIGRLVPISRLHSSGTEKEWLQQNNNNNNKREG